MTAVFAIDFPARSPLVRRKPLEVPIDEVIAAVASDLDRRRSTYPQMVTRGRLDQAEADRRCSIWAAIVADLHRHRAILKGRPIPADAEWAGSWEERVAEIRRELAKRRDAYPRWVETPSHPMTASAATLSLERLDALHYIYWNDLTDFSGPDVWYRDDHARVAWIARMEQSRLAPGGGAQLDLNEEQAMWHAIGEVAERYVAGKPNPDDRSLCGRAARWTMRRAEQLIGETETGALPAHLYTWTLYADSWLTARMEEKNHVH